MSCFFKQVDTIYEVVQDVSGRLFFYPFKEGGSSLASLKKLDPVGSTVRYEMMKPYTGSVKDTMRQ